MGGVAQVTARPGDEQFEEELLGLRRRAGSMTNWIASSGIVTEASDDAPADCRLASRLASCISSSTEIPSNGT